MKFKLLILVDIFKFNFHQPWRHVSWATTSGHTSKALTWSSPHPTWPLQRTPASHNGTFTTLPGTPLHPLVTPPHVTHRSCIYMRLNDPWPVGGLWLACWREVKLVGPYTCAPRVLDWCATCKSPLVPHCWPWSHLTVEGGQLTNQWSHGPMGGRGVLYKLMSNHAWPRWGGGGHRIPIQVGYLQSCTFLHEHEIHICRWWLFK